MARLKGISKDEISELETILKSDINDQIKIAVNILMVNKKLADNYMQCLNDEEKKDFIEYPIYYLYEKLK